jgi:hypothetical protein
MHHTFNMGVAGSNPAGVTNKNEMDTHNVINTWKNDSVVYKGNEEQCKNYINGNNVYQMNYSKLRLKTINNTIMTDSDNSDNKNNNKDM